VNLMTAGNTDGVDAVMRACFDRGDYMLVEEFGGLFFSYNI
jgi:aromatic amino acid aminotransferase I